MAQAPIDIARVQNHLAEHTAGGDALDSELRLGEPEAVDRVDGEEHCEGTQECNPYSDASPLLYQPTHSKRYY